MSTVLIVEDEQILREELAEALSEQGYNVLSAGDGAQALNTLQTNAVQLVISDLRLPKMDGLEVLRRAREASPETQFIMMTAFGSVDTAIEAMRAGASDYLIKPLALDETLVKVGRIMEAAELRLANRMLKRDLDRTLGPLEMVGSSPQLEKVRQLIRKVAPTRSHVLISGESGTGKELVARAVHALGSPKNEPFVPVNCAAIPETLLESELFGHQKGAFTGAIAEAEGLFRAARKGTLFLDEIGDLPMSLQAKLLRVLEDKMIHPVGSSKFIPFEARVIAASNRDLKQEIDKGVFREDLYFRLAVIELHLPPLRERQEDLALLVNHFVRRFNRELKRNYTGVEDAALQRVKSLPWKGNIRELQNMIERAMIVGNEPMLTSTDLIPLARADFGPSPRSKLLKDAVTAFEQMHIRNVLQQCEGDKRRAAKELGISLSSLYRYLEERHEEAEAPAGEETRKE